VLANGDPKAFRYIIKWTAWTLQNPGARAEVALIFKGGRGTGKGVFARAIKEAFGQHGMHISSDKHLTGHFNAHFQDCALLFADEAY
jgi:phage/plasmid-associated DNA primase